MAHISIVIPVFLGDTCLPQLYNRIVAAVSPLDQNFELVLVDDSSPDKSWSVIERLGAEDTRVKGIRFTRNFGQQCAITAGLQIATGDWVVVMDCDLQDRPEEIPQLYQRALDGFDVVIAKRGQRADNLVRIVCSEMFYKILGLLLQRSFDPEEGSFRIISRRVRDQVLTFNEQIRLFGEIVRWLGFPTASVPVQHSASARGKSSYSAIKLLNLAIDMIIVHSDRMLRLATAGGFVTALGGLGLGIYIFVQALTNRSPVYGWSSLIVSVSFFSGVIIGMLGLIGLFLSKIHLEIRQRPLYAIRQYLNVGAPFDSSKKPSESVNLVPV